MLAPLITVSAAIEAVGPAWAVPSDITAAANAAASTMRVEIIANPIGVCATEPSSPVMSDLDIACISACSQAFLLGSNHRVCAQREKHFLSASYVSGNE
jgi:hypothetical protein